MKEMDLVKKETCCFTGHRPQKLQWRFYESDARCVRIKLLVKKEIQKAIDLGYQNFITGMALGCDMICAEIVMELKAKNPNINLVCALPCKQQDKFWSDEQKLRYKNIINHADLVLCLHEKYTNDCMEERNRYMVNNSSLVIALFNGEQGGTSKTIEYAKSQNKRVVIVNV